MKKILLIVCITVIISLAACSSKKDDPILLADREAPLGWVYLRIYADSSFEFESSGMIRNSDIYSGKAIITKDSIFFDYNGEIPKAGDKAIYSDDYVEYVNGKYPELVKISMSKLKN